MWNITWNFLVYISSLEFCKISSYFLEIEEQQIRKFNYLVASTKFFLGSSLSHMQSFIKIGNIDFVHIEPTTEMGDNLIIAGA